MSAKAWTKLEVTETLKAFTSTAGSDDAPVVIVVPGYGQWPVRDISFDYTQGVYKISCKSINDKS